MTTTQPSSAAAAITAAASFIRDAKYVLITAGAGMSVDSGLPDFRGPEGFWRAYPPFRALGKRFEEMSNPEWFRTNPRVAWGFFGHRLQLYRSTVPHDGYRILESWQHGASGEDAHRLGCSKRLFVFTSNVDGAFEKSGFQAAQILECHGTGTRLQCTDWRCAAKHGPYPTPSDLHIDVDMSTVEAPESQMPRCPHCGSLARPNILMFNDDSCDMRVINEQEMKFNKFCEELDESTSGSVAVIELGAGTFVTTIRRTTERFASAYNAKMIRVNLREPEVAESILAVGLPMGALEAIRSIDAAMRQ
jgi:NAD-dependent SIR2 family protein deacetylase